MYFGFILILNLIFAQMFHGNLSLDEVMSRLLSAHETYSAQLALEVREEEERAARDAVKREQDLAYEMSLQVSILLCQSARFDACFIRCLRLKWDSGIFSASKSNWQDVHPGRLPCASSDL